MDRNDIALRVASSTGVQQVKARQIVNKILDDMIDCLVTEGNLELRNFGIFKVKTLKARPARNPRTGEEVMLPERKVVRFKPGKVMKERLSGPKK